MNSINVDKHIPPLWSDEELLLFREYYPRHTKDEILVVLPNRSWSAILNRARVLGIKRMEWHRDPDKILWGKDSPAWKGSKTVVTCATCGRTVSKYVYSNPKLGKRYCSKQCQNKGRIGFKHTNETKKLMSNLKTKLKASKEEVAELYWNRGLTCFEIGVELGVTAATVARVMRDFKIPKRSKREWNKLKGLTQKQKEAHANFVAAGHSWVRNNRDQISKRVKKLWQDPTYRKEQGEYHGERLKQLYKDPEFLKNRMKKLAKKPTRPEQRIITVIEKYELPLEYVGDGAVIIGNLNPDFIFTNGVKGLVEVFGRYWHETYKRVDWKRSEFGRKAVFSQLGYSTLILWDDEIYNMDDNQLYNKINDFLGRLT